MTWIPLITKLTLLVCALCFAGGGAFALYFKDDPSKTTMAPGKAWALIGGGVVIALFALLVLPRMYS